MENKIIFELNETAILYLQHLRKRSCLDQDFRRWNSWRQKCWAKSGARLCTSCRILLGVTLQISCGDCTWCVVWWSLESARNNYISRKHFAMWQVTFMQIDDRIVIYKQLRISTYHTYNCIYLLRNYYVLLGIAWCASVPACNTTAQLLGTYAHKASKASSSGTVTVWSLIDATVV